jgi:hypothetical protein
VASDSFPALSEATRPSTRPPVRLGRTQLCSTRVRVTTGRVRVLDIDGAGVNAAVLLPGSRLRDGETSVE